MQVETTDGRKMERIVNDNWGSEYNPMTPDQVRRKFRENAVLVLETARVERLLESVERVENLSDVGEIVANCIAA